MSGMGVERTALRIHPRDNVVCLLRDFPRKDFASDVEVESEDGVTVLSFDGATVGKIERSKKRDSEDSLSISGLGQNMTLDRETVVKDGKSRTRIVIEMDGDEDIEIDLPEQ